MTTLQAVLATYAVASLLALGAFALDKRRAARDEPRIRERTLHLLELVGGWPGALVAIFFLRHKSSKWSFKLVTFLIALAHGTAWFFWFSRP